MKPDAIGQHLSEILHICKGLAKSLTQVSIQLERETPRPNEENISKGRTARIKFSLGDGIQAVIGILLFLTLIYSVRSYNLTRDNFVKDEAPYIWPEPQPPIFENLKPISWNIGYSNYGKSVALNVRHCGFISMMPNAESQMHDVDYDDCRKSGIKVTDGVVIPPGYKVYLTLQTPLNVIYLDSEEPMLNKTDGFLAGEGVFVYNDSSGNTYRSHYRFKRLANNQLMHCDHFNYIKKVE